MMLNQICYQVSKPEIEFHIIDIMHEALHIKDNIFMQRRLEQIFTHILEQRQTCHWTYSGLWYILVRFYFYVISALEAVLLIENILIFSVMLIQAKYRFDVKLA